LKAPSSALISHSFSLPVPAASSLRQNPYNADARYICPMPGSAAALQSSMGIRCASYVSCIM